MSPHILRHPGPSVLARTSIAASRTVRHARARLMPGRSLQQAMEAVTSRLGATSGTASLIGGGFSSLRFTTGGPDRHGAGRAANYTWIRDWGAADLVSGEISFGRARNSDLSTPALFVHCHAILWPDPEGIPQGEAPAAVTTGGHLFPADCRISQTIEAFVTVFDGFAMHQTDDKETGHSIFEIAEEAADA